MTTVEVPLGAKVSVAAGLGFVRWTGSNAKFAAGKWVGVELLEPNGKNDGSVQGQRYFDCQPKYGVFVRPSQVTIVEEPAKATPAKSTLPRPSTGPTISRVSSAASARASSPSQAVQSGASTATPSSTPLRTLHSSSGTPAAPPARGESNDVFSVPGGPGIPRTTSFRRPPSVADSIISRAQTPLSNDGDEDTRAMPPPPIPSVRVPTSSRNAPHTAAIPAIGSEPGRAPTPNDESSAASFAQKRETEELKIKVRILESRRAEDQERIKSLEAKVGEADTLRAARVKLQSKFQELQASLVAAQRMAKDLQNENTHLQSRTMEAMENLEMATLDREVAEEKAESSQLELEKLGEKVADMEMEIAILKEENAEYEKPAGLEGERTSAAFVQLEKHNERLKEALIRLRDVSTEAEKEHKAKISKLEKDLSSHDELTRRCELAEANLTNAESHIEDLKQQLDDALGAEDMLEQLTERNLQMGERIEEMRVTIEDLEALKELNDELEEGHHEAEKQLNNEIDRLGVQLRDERKRSSDLETAVLDMEGTLTQFRDLVSDLQGEIEDLQMQQLSQEAASSINSKEAQALLDLNMKMQSSAVKAQSRNIDLDLQRLEATQLAEQVKLITAYLPDKYHETDADSASLYLFFQRIASKVETLISAVSASNGLPSALHTADSETLVGICELRGKLRHFCCLNKRFAAVMMRSSPEEWVELGKILIEVGGVENKVDAWINGVRNDEFNEGDCARDLGSLIAQFDHLAGTIFDWPELDIGERQLELAHAFECDLDNFAAAIGFARQSIVALTKEDDTTVDVEDSSLEDSIYEPVQRILNLISNVKGPALRLVSEIEGVVLTKSALLPEATELLSELDASVSKAVDLAVQLAQRISAHISSLRTTKAPLRLADIESFLTEVTAESAHANDAPPWVLIGMFIERLGENVGSILPQVRGAIKAGQIVSKAEVPPPWLARVAETKAAASFNAESERKLASLSEELKDMLREIKIRDQSLQESGIKVETLERRLETTRKQAEQIVDLENDVAKAKKQEKVYEEAIEQLQRDLDQLEAKNAKLEKGDRQPSTLGPDAALPPAMMDHGMVSEQIENLRLAIRFLRKENALLKSKEIYRDLNLLPKLSYIPSEEDVPELDPSGPNSPSSSSDDGSIGPITPSKHTIEMESKLLWREVSEWTAAPKIVDLSKVAKSGWTRRKGGPEEQIYLWKEQEKELARRVERLGQRTRLFKR